MEDRSDVLLSDFAKKEARATGTLRGFAIGIIMGFIVAIITTALIH